MIFIFVRLGLVSYIMLYLYYSIVNAHSSKSLHAHSFLLVYECKGSIIIAEFAFFKEKVHFLSVFAEKCLSLPRNN